MLDISLLLLLAANKVTTCTSLGVSSAIIPGAPADAKCSFREGANASAKGMEDCPGAPSFSAPDAGARARRGERGSPWAVFHTDRKSTRLNSSHQIISYAV